MQREISQRVSNTLAMLPDNAHHAFYELLASVKMPGMGYLEVLWWLHQALKPKLYVEIGVRQGNSLFLADKSTRCIGIDPRPNLAEMRENVELSVTTSAKFFYHSERAETVRDFDLAFIDGDHSFEQAARDFANLERLAGLHSIIAIHDVIPMDERTAQPPDPVTGHTPPFHTGNVWRLMAAIVADRPDLVAITIPCAPSGLGLVGRFGTPGAVGVRGIEAWSSDTFPTDWDDAVKMLNIIPNDPKQWGAALRTR